MQAGMEVSHKRRSNDDTPLSATSSKFQKRTYFLYTRITPKFENACVPLLTFGDEQTNIQTDRQTDEPDRQMVGLKVDQSGAQSGDQVPVRVQQHILNRVHQYLPYVARKRGPGQTWNKTVTLPLMCSGAPDCLQLHVLVTLRLDSSFGWLYCFPGRLLLFVTSRDLSGLLHCCLVPILASRRGEIRRENPERSSEEGWLT
jgi:hypothetical protein